MDSGSGNNSPRMKVSYEGVCGEYTVFPGEGELSKMPTVLSRQMSETQSVVTRAVVSRGVSPQLGLVNMNDQQ